MFFLNMTWHISPIIACTENWCQDLLIILLASLAFGFCICIGLTFSPLKQIARIFVWKPEDLFIVALYWEVDNYRSLYILHHLAQPLFKLRRQASLSGTINTCSRRFLAMGEKAKLRLSNKEAFSIGSRDRRKENRTLAVWWPDNQPLFVTTSQDHP